MELHTGIDQTFPAGSLAMVNIPYSLKCREEEMKQAGFDGVALDEKVDIKKSSFMENICEKSCGCDQWIISETRNLDQWFCQTSI